MNLYRMNSNPLEIDDDVDINTRYCMDNGNIIIPLVVVDGNVTEYEIDHNSELISGALVTELTEEYLSLFWKLTRNNWSNTLIITDADD